jgi:hypothetical protein
MKSKAKASLGSNALPTRVRKCKKPTPNTLKWVLIMRVGSFKVWYTST